MRTITKDTPRNFHCNELFKEIFQSRPSNACRPAHLADPVCRKVGHARVPEWVRDDSALVRSNVAKGRSSFQAVDNSIINPTSPVESHEEFVPESKDEKKRPQGYFLNLGYGIFSDQHSFKMSEQSTSTT